MRASRISHTASILPSWAWIMRRVLVMWPGYHWMFMPFSTQVPPLCQSMKPTRLQSRLPVSGVSPGESRNTALPWIYPRFTGPKR